MPGPGMEWVGEEEIKEVLEVLRGGYLYRYGVLVGDEVDPRFKGKVYQVEQEIAAYSKVKYGLAVNSGTSALLAALAGIGIGPGDEVIVPPFTFVASATAVLLTASSGTTPDRETGRTLPAVFASRKTGCWLTRSPAVYPTAMMVLAGATVAPTTDSVDALPSVPVGCQLAPVPVLV